MNLESESARRLLGELANRNESLIKIAGDLRKRSTVRSVQHNFQLRAYRTGHVLECYVDAELHNGKAIGWWLEVQSTELDWLIRHSVRLNHSDGEDAIQQFPDVHVESLDDLLKHLHLGIEDLAKSAETLDLGKL